MVETLADLHAAGVGILTIGQYLSPSASHLPVARYYHPDEFEMLRVTAVNMGFGHVECGPLVRSSYHAHEQTNAFESRKPAARTSSDDARASTDPCHRLPTTSAASWPRTPKAQLVDMLYQMLLGRRYEEKCAEMYALQKIGGFCHLYIGQEAVAIGALSTLRPDDLIITAYRDHVHALVKGCDPGRVMAELFGRRDGVSRGKGGSMHLFDKEKGMLGGHGIVGGHIPAGHRHGVRRQVPAEGLRDAVLLRRGRGQHRHLPRIAQHGGALEAAGHLHRREQPVRHGDGHRAVVGHLRRRPARLRLRHGQRDGGRHGRPRRARGHRPRRRPGAPRERCRR